MKLKLSELDEQIREVENRIAVERIAFEDAKHDCVDSLREAVTSPKTLLAVLGVGFAVGKVMFKTARPQPQQVAVAKKAGALGMLTGVAGTALSLAGSRWATIATWAARRYFARNKAPSSASAPPSASRATAFPR
jgi:H+/gluconate symporter-like permease